jgi:hypothetical protein
VISGVDHSMGRFHEQRVVEAQERMREKNEGGNVAKLVCAASSSSNIEKAILRADWRSIAK